MPLRKVSSFYETEPVGFAEQPDFMNAVAAIAWEGTARSLLSLVQEIERRVGRTPTFRDGPREIDVDILDLGGLVRRRPNPVLPHPRLSSRRFVLEPLAEIAPDWTHPVSGRTARELLEGLPERPSVRRIGRAEA
jgi:2-amino-4-hydroxy-6-hydroxymethyldihydropteridine diphosphokinase